MEFNKFGRTYFVTVTDVAGLDKKTMTIGMPLTCKFSLNRNWGLVAGNGVIQLYNLNKDSRAFLRKDTTDLNTFRLVSITAGHLNEQATLMEGYLQSGSSVRQGTDYITTLNISDMTNAWRNATFSGSFKSNTFISTIIKNIAKSLEAYGIKTGTISRSINGKTKRGTSLTGKSVDLIDEITGGQFFVDNGVLNVLPDNEYIDGTILRVSNRYGLIGKPRREGQNVIITLLLEPRAYVGQQASVLIENDDDDFNGTYYVRSISHVGTISETIGETATTEIYLTPNKFGTAAK